MPACFTIRWQPSGVEQEFFASGGYRYKLSDSDHLDVKSMPVWCNSCQVFTDGEDISTLGEIDHEIRDLNDPTSRLFYLVQQIGEFDPVPQVRRCDSVRKSGESAVERELTDLQRRRRWRVLRCSGPKCLYCGSTEIVSFEIGTPAPDPFGEGMIQINFTGHWSGRWNETFYTPEGDRIPRQAPAS